MSEEDDLAATMTHQRPEPNPVAGIKQGFQNFLGPQFGGEPGTGGIMGAIKPNPISGALNSDVAQDALGITGAGGKGYNLVKTRVRPSIYWADRGKEVYQHQYDIIHPKGLTAGSASVSDMGDTLRLDWIGGNAALSGQVGLRDTAKFMVQLRDEFPNAEWLEANRVTGARLAADQDKFGKFWQPGDDVPEGQKAATGKMRIRLRTLDMKQIKALMAFLAGGGAVAEQQGPEGVLENPSGIPLQ